MFTFNSILELKPNNSMWKIKIKIIRLWKNYSTASGKSIEMVLCDFRVSVADGFIYLYNFE